MQTVAERRVELGISQDQLAQTTGYPKLSISGWESGKHAPPLTKFLDILQALGMGMNLFVKGTKV